MNPKIVITIFLYGDVMIGRGIDQILPHPGDPTLYEPYVRTARTYVQIAKRRMVPSKDRWNSTTSKAMHWLSSTRQAESATD